MAGSEHLRGGELDAAVTSALVGIHSVHLGRGPKGASTFHYGNVIVALMEDVRRMPNARWPRAAMLGP